MTKDELMKLKLKSYLGDGVYIGFDGYQTWVWAERPDDCSRPFETMQTHSIALDFGVIQKLDRYTRELMKHVGVLKSLGHVDLSTLKDEL